MFLMFNVWHGYISLHFLENLKLNRLINAEYQHKLQSVTKGYPLFIHLDHKHVLYSIFHVWTVKKYPNYRPTKRKYFIHTRSLSRFLCIWNIKMIMLTSLPLPLLHFSIIFEIRKQKQNTYILETFDWLTKITHIIDGGVYLKRPKRLFDISVLDLSH